MSKNEKRVCGGESRRPGKGETGYGKIHVLLMCSSGMSSTIIKANMAKAAEKMGIDLTVDAKAESAVNVEA